ncbi:hypothetical protein [Methylibium sp.]|uniref:hypothetical protein n=1 Tax=Methylibium sp. TaxID=2067992 RepID=UPI00333EAA74
MSMMSRAWTLIFFLVVLGGCGSKAPVVVEKKPVVKTIAVMQVVEPTKMEIQNLSSVMFLVPIASIAFNSDSKHKSKIFAAAMARQNMTMGSVLTNVLVEELKGGGYDVVIVDAVPVPEDEPDEMDYRQFKTDVDAILYVYFDDVGLHSGAGSNDYRPRVNISGALHLKDVEDDFYHEDFSYGVDARAGKSWAVMADPRYAYPSFEAVIAKAPEIREAFESGAQAIGRRMAADIKSALK